jgi:hypothetical protein
MADEELIQVRNITPFSGLDQHSDAVDSRGDRRGGYGHQHDPRRMHDYFRTLAKAAEASNEQLVHKDVPLRFCVYEQGSLVFLDIVKLDAAGKVQKTVRRNITDDDFEHWIDDISHIEGLLIDAEA